MIRCRWPYLPWGSPVPLITVLDAYLTNTSQPRLVVETTSCIFRLSLGKLGHTQHQRNRESSQSRLFQLDESHSLKQAGVQPYVWTAGPERCLLFSYSESDFHDMCCQSNWTIIYGQSLFSAVVCWVNRIVTKQLHILPLRHLWGHLKGSSRRETM